MHVTYLPTARPRFTTVAFRRSEFSWPSFSRVLDFSYHSKVWCSSLSKEVGDLVVAHLAGEKKLTRWK